MKIDQVASLTTRILALEAAQECQTTFTDGIIQRYNQNFDYNDSCIEALEQKQKKQAQEVEEREGEVP